MSSVGSEGFPEIKYNIRSEEKELQTPVTFPVISPSENIPTENNIKITANKPINPTTNKPKSFIKTNSRETNIKS